jgi:hypothetical protein
VIGNRKPAAEGPVSVDFEEVIGLLMLGMLAGCGVVILGAFLL